MENLPRRSRPQKTVEVEAAVKQALTMIALTIPKCFWQQGSQIYNLQVLVMKRTWDGYFNDGYRKYVYL